MTLHSSPYEAASALAAQLGCDVGSLRRSQKSGTRGKVSQAGYHMCLSCVMLAGIKGHFKALISCYSEAAKKLKRPLDAMWPGDLADIASRRRTRRFLAMPLDLQVWLLTLTCK